MNSMFGSTHFIRDYLLRIEAVAVHMAITYLVAVTLMTLAFGPHTAGGASIATTIAWAALSSALLMLSLQLAGYNFWSAGIVNLLPISERDVSRSLWWCNIAIPIAVITFIVNPLAIALIHYLAPEAINKLSVSHLVLLLLSTSCFAAFALIAPATSLVIYKLLFRYVSVVTTHRFAVWNIRLVAAGSVLLPLALLINAIAHDRITESLLIAMSAAGVGIYIVLWFFPHLLIHHISINNSSIPTNDSVPLSIAAKRGHLRGWSWLLYNVVKTEAPKIVIFLVLFNLWPQGIVTGLFMFCFVGYERPPQLFSGLGAAKALPISRQWLSAVLMLTSILSSTFFLGLLLATIKLRNIQIEPHNAIFLAPPSLAYLLTARALFTPLLLIQWKVSTTPWMALLYMCSSVVIFAGGVSLLHNYPVITAAICTVSLWLGYRWTLRELTFINNATLQSYQQRKRLFFKS